MNILTFKKELKSKETSDRLIIEVLNKVDEYLEENIKLLKILLTKNPEDIVNKILEVS